MWGGVAGVEGWQQGMLQSKRMDAMFEAIKPGTSPASKTGPSSNGEVMERLRARMTERQATEFRDRRSRSYDLHFASAHQHALSTDTGAKIYSIDPKSSTLR